MVKTIILSILLAGLGHMYLGNYRRGVLILISALAMGLFFSFFESLFWVIPPIIFFIWQIYDASREYEKRKPFLAEIICRYCNWTNNNYSKYCTKCGNEI